MYQRDNLEQKTKAVKNYEDSYDPQFDQFLY